MEEDCDDRRPTTGIIVLLYIDGRLQDVNKILSYNTDYYYVRYYQLQIKDSIETIKKDFGG